MSIIQSNTAKGIDPVPNAFEAGCVVAHKVDFTFTAAAAENDILELAVLPARHRIIEIYLDTTGTITVAKTGLMSGEVGSKAADRTVGDTLVASGKANAAARAAQPVEADRSIGLLLTAASAGAKASITVLYAQGI